MKNTLTYESLNDRLHLLYKANSPLACVGKQVISGTRCFLVHRFSDEGCMTKTTKVPLFCEAVSVFEVLIAVSFLQGHRKK